MKRKITAHGAILLIFCLLFGMTAIAAENTDQKSESLTSTGIGAPMFSAIEPCSEGLLISWKAISGVPSYRLYRRYDDGRGWVAFKDTSALSLIDSNVIDGNTYRYRLAGVSSSGTVLTATASTEYTYANLPHITSAEVVQNGVRIQWTKPESAHSVAVFRKDSGWTRLTSSTGTTYTDASATKNGSYTYTLRSLNQSGAYVSDYYDEVGFTIRRVATPSLTVSPGEGGLSVSWKAVENAEKYRVFVKDGNSWARIADTDKTYYLDTSAPSGAVRTYTVRCVTADGKTYTSYYDTAGKSASYIAAPVLRYAEAANNGVKVVWNALEGAAKYRVFRYAGSNWKRIGDTAAATFTDTSAAPGAEYTYTVRCLDADGAYISSFDHKGVSLSYLPMPVLKTASCGTEGVNLSWNAIDGAEKYRVYRRTTGGWARLTDTEETAFTDQSASSGTTYTYTVRCLNADGTLFTSGHTSGRSVAYVAAPTVKATYATGGVQLSWNASAGAGRYRVYMQTASGWKRLSETTATSYLDTSAVSGSTYTYTVRCLDEKGAAFVSAFKPSEPYTYISAPDFTLTRNEKSVTVSWQTHTGAELYRVYRMTDSGWKRLADTTGTAYEDTSVVSGNTYTYTVRCLNKDATAFTSGYHSGKSIRFVEMPKISAVEKTAEGVTLKWNAVSGAVKYRVYRMTDSGWKRLADTTGTAYLDTTALSGDSYVYTLRCVNAAGNAFESAYDPNGIALKFVTTPTGLKAVPSGNAVLFSWKPSPGAEKYRAYYYGEKGWTKFAETTETSVTDTSIPSGATRRYTVRCITADGKEFTSGYDRDGVTCTFTELPVLKQPTLEKEGVRLSWSASEGAAKYRVYYYGSKGWTKFAETTETTAKDLSIPSGTTRRYTVRCLSADGKVFTSDFDRDGKSVYYVAAPKISNVSTTAKRVTLTWDQPNGADRYRVYKKVSGKWKKLTETASNSYTDSSVSLGSTYIYTVRCLNSGGAFVSWYDEEGYTVTVIEQAKDFQYYNQLDYDYPFGDDTIAYSGCGPTCMAMVASTITGRTITPIDAVWCGNDYYVDHVGTRWDYFEVAADRFGVNLVAQYDETSFSAVMNELKKGRYVISAQRYGLFTSGGHFIVLAGVDENGDVIVYDPNGWKGYIGTAFDPDDVSVSGTQYWVFDEK